MSEKKTYFISDLHLGASYIKDPKLHERIIVDWLKSIEPCCSRLFLLGDVLDYWFEYKYVVPKGFTRFFGQLASMSDAGIEITWLIGNHDIWIFEYLPSELGIRVIDGALEQTIDGKKFYMAHGDAIGSLTPGFRAIRRVFRSRFCQKLYSAIHPRWTVPFAYRWSSSNRNSYGDKYSRYRGDDVEPFVPWAKELIATHNELDYIILGHRHILFEKKIGEKCTLVILGDWISNFSYAVFDGQTLKLSKLSIDKSNC